MTKKFEADCYVLDDKQFGKYRDFELDGIVDFNHASLQRPFKEAHDAVSNSKQHPTYKEGRKAAAGIVNIEDETRVIFARNTTEALSFAYWLSNADGGKVVYTDAENKSVARIFEEHRDHGNTKGLDGWSTFPDKIVAEEFDGLEGKIKTNAKTMEVPFLEGRDYKKIIDAVDEQTRIVVISHVIRNDGQILDIEAIARGIKEKNPNTFVAVDGAQALGSLPVVDFNVLEAAGVDFYAATPHKTMGSYPLGILYISKRAAGNMHNLSGLSQEQQIIMEGMLDESLGINTNIVSPLNKRRITAFVSSLGILTRLGYLSGNDFSRKTEYESGIKMYFARRLKGNGAKVLEDPDNEYSPAIISFSLGPDNKDIVRELHKSGILMSYISETDNIRASFDIKNSKAEVDKFFEHLHKMA